MVDDDDLPDATMNAREYEEWKRIRANPIGAMQDAMARWSRLMQRRLVCEVCIVVFSTFAAVSALVGYPWPATVTQVLLATVAVVAWYVTSRQAAVAWDTLKAAAKVHRTMGGDS